MLPTSLIFARAWLHRDAEYVAVGMTLDGVPVAIEATLGGVRIWLRSHWERARRVVAEYQFKVDVSEAVRCTLRDFDDERAHASKLRSGLRAVFNRFDNPLANPHRFACTKFVLQLDPDQKVIPEWDGLDDETTEPEDLLRRCRTRRSFVAVSDETPDGDSAP